MQNPIEALAQKLPSDFCLLCGGAPDVLGVFVPQEPEAWGSTKGKGRIFRYCLCSKCHNMPDAAERTEKIVRAELTGGGVTDAS